MPGEAPSNMTRPVSQGRAGSGRILEG